MLRRLRLRQTHRFNPKRYFNDRSFVNPAINSAASSKLLTAISDAKSLGIELQSFPNIIMIGPQSSGKSSVTEALCGVNILPKAMKMSTMKSVHITLIKSKDSKISVGTREFKSETEAAEEIKRLNENGYIKIINVEIHSPDVYNCSLVDLPGLFVVASDDNAGLPKEVKNLTIKYLEDPNNIPVVVHSAPSDAATNQAINLVKKTGKGNQSFMVITKVDQAQTGKQRSSHITKMLNRELYDLGYGSVAVVLRSDSDLEEGKTINKKIEEEALFFKKNNLFPSGVIEMRRIISDIQLVKIRDQIPKLLTDIQVEIDATKTSKTFMDDLIGNDQSKLALQLRIMIEKLVGSSSERAIFENRLKEDFQKIIKKHINELIANEHNLNLDTSEYKKKLSNTKVDSTVVTINKASKSKPSDYKMDSIKELFSYGLSPVVFMDNSILNDAVKAEEKLALTLPMIQLQVNDPLGKKRVDSNRMLNRFFSKMLQDDTIHKMIRDITEMQLLTYIEEDTENCSELTKKFAQFMISEIGNEAYESKIKYSITAMLNLEKRPQISLFEIERYITQMYPEYFNFDIKGQSIITSIMEPYSKPKIKIDVYGPEWQLAYLQVVGDKLAENCYRNVTVNLLDRMVEKLLEVCFDMFNKNNVEKQKKKIEQKVSKLEEIRDIIKSFEKIE